MFNEISDFLRRYDPDWIGRFLLFAFGKYHYTHALSEKSLNCYLSNLRSVNRWHPDDDGCVTFYVGHNFYNLVDYKDPKLFLEMVKRYLNLKAFL